MLKANADDILPTDDHYIKVFEKSQKELQNNQAQYINYKWYKRQFDAVNRFNEESYTFQVKNLYNLKGSVGKRRYSLRYIIEQDCDLFTELHHILLYRLRYQSLLKQF